MKMDPEAGDRVPGGRILDGMRIALLTCILLAPQTLPAATQAMPANKVVEPLDAAHLVQVSLGLVAVMALIFAAAWLLRRAGRLSNSAQGRLRVLGGLSLGARERVMLIEAGTTQLLVGVAPGRVQTLAVLDRPIVQDTTVASPFAERLGTVLTRTSGA